MIQKTPWAKLITPSEISRLDNNSLLKRKGEVLASVVIFQSLENPKLILDQIKDIKVKVSEEVFRNLFLKFAFFYTYWLRYYFYTLSDMSTEKQAIVTQKFSQTLNEKMALFEWGDEWLADFKNKFGSDVDKYVGKVFLNSEDLHNSVVWQFSKEIMELLGVSEDIWVAMPIIDIILHSVDFIDLPELFKL